MKKFLLSGCVCTPSVKGIYTVLFVLILTIPAFAQIEMKDSKTDVPFYKWSVDFDLKPLFRKEEPFSLLVKRYTSPTRAWRLGFGFYGSNTPTAKRYYDSYKPDSSVYFTAEKISNRVNTYLTIGRQFEKKKDRITIYTSSDIAMTFDLIKDEKRGVSASNFGINNGLWPTNKLYVDTIVYYRSLGLSLSQSLGFKYYFNKQISCSFEANVLVHIGKTQDNLDSQGSLTTNDNRPIYAGDLPFASKDFHRFYYLQFNPIAHIYLSYHF